MEFKPNKSTAITTVADGKSSPLGDEGLMFAGDLASHPVCLLAGTTPWQT